MIAAVYARKSTDQHAAGCEALEAATRVGRRF
jgi:hypothetical protein